MNSSKLCTDPWAKIVVRSNGNVYLCCTALPIGNIATDRLSNLINNDRARSYRIGLLTGNLQPECHTCITKIRCSIEEEQAAVEEYLATGKEY